jgi:PAS domain S-box-containing protein
MVEDTILYALINKHHFEMEYRLLHKDGEIRWVFERGQGIFDPTENNTYVDGYIYDITARKQVEAALERSEDEVKRLALVAHNTTNSVLIADKEELIMWVNEGFTRITGYTLDEIKGKKIGYSLEGPKSDEKAKTRLRHALENKLSFKEEFLSYAKNGATIWLEVDCQPLFDENNKHIGFMSIENDITRRKQAQMEQQELLQRLTLATDSAKIGIWEVDLTDNHIIWDDKMFELYGYEKDTPFPPYKIWKRAMHPDDLEMMQRIIGDLVAGKRDIDSAIYRITMPNGRIRHVESHAIVKKSSSGRVLRLIGTNRNITDDVVIQEKLKTQNKVLRDIAFIQSHEVRRPLANILGVIEVLNNSNSVHNKEIFDHLIESANELDMQIRSIVKKTNNLDGLVAG